MLSEGEGPSRRIRRSPLHVVSDNFHRDFPQPHSPWQADGFSGSLDSGVRPRSG
jgi:hypothetical protein